MADTLFKIVFQGQLRDGVDLDTAKQNLARLFKSEASAVEKLFNGNPVALKRGLTRADAQVYLDALNQAGVEAGVEEDLAISLSLDEIETTPAYGQPLESAGASPYAPPRSALDEPTFEYGEVKALGIQGRIGRLRYLARTLVLMTAALLIAFVCAIIMSLSLTGGALLMAVTFAAFLVFNIQFGVRRLHDLGWSGWLLLLTILPYVGTIFFLLMVCIPGNKGPNSYGPPPPPNTRGTTLLACLWLLLIALFVASGQFGAMDILQEQLDATTAEYEQSLPYDDAAQQPGPDSVLEDEEDQ